MTDVYFKVRFACERDEKHTAGQMYVHCYHINRCKLLNCTLVYVYIYWSGVSKSCGVETNCRWWHKNILWNDFVNVGSLLSPSLFLCIYLDMSMNMSIRVIIKKLPPLPRWHTPILRHLWLDLLDTERSLGGAVNLPTICRATNNSTEKTSTIANKSQKHVHNTLPRFARRSVCTKVTQL